MRIIAALITLLLTSMVQASDSSLAAYICGGVSNASEYQQCLERAAVVTPDRVTDGASLTPPALLSFIWPIGWWVIYYGFGLVIGRYIYRDAKKRRWFFLGIRPVWWAVFAVFEPAMGLIAYWATHYSQLSQNYSETLAAENHAPPQP